MQRIHKKGSDHNKIMYQIPKNRKEVPEGTRLQMLQNSLLERQSSLYNPYKTWIHPQVLEFGFEKSHFQKPRTYNCLDRK